MQKEQDQPFKMVGMVMHVCSSSGLGWDILGPAGLCLYSMERAPEPRSLSPRGCYSNVLILAIEHATALLQRRQHCLLRSSGDTPDRRDLDRPLDDEVPNATGSGVGGTKTEEGRMYRRETRERWRDGGLRKGALFLMRC
jgi:hypothetical protein